MRSQIALPDLLDQGLLIYRRNWTQLLLFGASVMLPVTLIGMALNTLVARSTRWDFPLGWLLLGGAVIALLLAYLLVGLARIAWACLLGQPLTLWAMFVLPPGRLLRLMLRVLLDWGCLIISTVIGWTLLSLVELGVVAMVMSARPGYSGTLPLLEVLLLTFTMLLVGIELWLALSLPVAMALYHIQSYLDWLERSQYRLPHPWVRGQWLAAGVGMLMVGAALLNVVGLLVLLQALLDFDGRLLGTLALATLVLSVVVLLPLPAIWAALLHQHSRQIVMGDDLDARVRGWLAA